MAVGAELDLPAALQRIVDAAVDLVDAGYGALGVLDESGNSLAEFVTAGLDDEHRRAIGELPKGRGLLGELIIHPEPLRLPELTEHASSAGFPPNHPPMHSFLGVPIVVRGKPFGNLYLCDKADGDVFTDIDEELVVALASAAAVAIDNARLHGRVADLALFEDRERIARDLHDTVIQRLFAVGLGLQASVRLSDDPALTARLESAVDDLDRTVRDIRSVIFELHAPRLPGNSVRQGVLDVCSEASRTLGFDPTVHFDGPIDSAVTEETAEHLLAVIREALSNVARHARASRAELRVRTDDEGLTLTVEDDGIGPAGLDSGGRGVDNMSTRARRLGGTSSITPRDGGGTLLRWEIPLPHC